MPRLDIVRAFVEQAGATTSNAELLRLLEDATSEMGFRYFAMVHHVDLRRASSHMIRLENYPESWASYFVEHGLFAEDPILQACLTSNMGFTWADVPKRIAITARQRAILETAAKHGLGDGYTVPANIPGESSGSCSFATRKGLSLPAENLLLAQLIGGFAFLAARRLSQDGSLPPPSPPRLTPRQRDCLLLAIQGKTDWEISRILDLSQETVSQHIDMARERYGVAKRTQLAIHAIFDGQISFSEAITWRFPQKRE